jgi:hypothetical protein
MGFERGMSLGRAKSFAFRPRASEAPLGVTYLWIPNLERGKAPFKGGISICVLN